MIRFRIKNKLWESAKKLSHFKGFRGTLCSLACAGMRSSVHNAVNHSDYRAIRYTQRSTLTGKTHVAKHTFADSSTHQEDHFLISRFITCALHHLAGTGAIICTILVIAGSAACSKENTADKYPPQKKELTQHILLILGENFDKPDTPFTHLSTVYSPNSLQTHLHVLSYRDMTSKTKKTNLTMISEYLAAQPAEAIISIGIPEGGARILRTVKERHPLMRIFSLLPVEEILPLEAVSNAVIDFAIPDSFAEADRPVHIPADSVQTLILCALIAAEQSRDAPEQQPFSQISRAIATGLALLTAHGKTAWGGMRYTLAPYKDPELNMQSYNYLILSPDNTTLQSDKQGTELSGSGENQ